MLKVIFFNRISCKGWLRQNRKHQPINDLIVISSELIVVVLGMTPSNELQIYTWLDATLKELTGLVKEVNPEARRRGTYFDFSLVYPDLRQSPRCQSRDIGTTVAGQRGPDDQKTLADCKFVIGDFLDIAITPPTGRMDRMDGYGRRGFGGDRRNGGFRDRDRERDSFRDRDMDGFRGGRDRDGRDRF